MTSLTKEQLLAEFDEKFPRATSIETSPNGAWWLNYDTHEVKAFLSHVYDTAVQAERERIRNTLTSPLWSENEATMRCAELVDEALKALPISN